MLDIIYNEDCFATMENMRAEQCDMILTSPFYNTNKKAGHSRTLQNTTVKDGQYHHVRYDSFVDNMTNEEYCDFTVRLFQSFDKVLKKNGVVVYNISYGAENTEGMFLAINDVLTKTNFTLADVIGWKKKTALPNSCSSNRLTRIFEFVFVFCRKSEFKTFFCNKKVTSTRATGQKMYENIFNLIEAPNNSENCPYNKATYSVELCDKLISLYCPRGGTVYDPFMGSGTTAVACRQSGRHYIGSEISNKQTIWANERLAREGKTRSDWLDDLLEN